MIIPKFLSEGETIGVTAPSFGVTDPTDVNRFANARKRLAELGHPVRETPDVYTADETGRSAPAAQRTSELQALLEDRSVGAIVAAKGGDYQFEMLLHMDWDHLERHPKWMQGYSDNTTLLFKITAEHDIATVYGAHFGDFGMEPWHRSVTEDLEILEGKRTVQESYPYHEAGFGERVTGLEGIREEEPTVWDSSCGDVKFKGRLIGGCMDVLEWFQAKATATPESFVEKYADEGIVWYMETYDMDAKRVAKMFRGMEKDGWFDGVTGFVFGRPLFFNGGDYKETVMEALKDYDVPMVFGADVGHKAPRMTFINGAMAELEIHNGSCTMTYDFSA